MPKEYGVTKEGFVLKRLDTILAEVNDYQKEGLGFDPYSIRMSAFQIATHLKSTIPSSETIPEALFLARSEEM